MRIAQLVTRRQLRGAEVFAADLSSELVNRGHEVLFVGLGTAVEPGLAPKGTTQRDLRESDRRPLSFRKLWELRTLLQDYKPDLVQANGSETLKYSAVLKRLGWLRCPLVYRNISIASRWLHTPAHLVWMRWLLGAVDHVVSVSDESRVDFARTFHLRAPRLTTIPIAVRSADDCESANARGMLAAAAGISTSHQLVVHIGSFSPEKNHRWLLNSFARVVTQRPGTHLILIGDGSLLKKVKAQITGVLDGRVHLLGARTDARVLVAGADVLVLPSLIEGIPGVLLEAGAAAVPVVATDVGGVREVVRDGVSGRLIPPGDTDAFVAAVISLLDDPQLRGRLGEAARRYVRDAYSMNSVVGAFERLYHTLVEQHVPSLPQ